MLIKFILGLTAWPFEKMSTFQYNNWSATALQVLPCEESGSMRWLRAVTLLGLLVLTTLNGCGRQSRDVAHGATRAPDAAGLPVTSRSTPVVGAPECVPSNGVLCLRDTAYQRSKGDGNLDAWATVLWFGRSGDSLVLSADAKALQTTIGDDKDSLHNNVPWFHRRIPHDGTVTIWTTLPEERGDSVVYALRVQYFAASSASSALEPTGETARLVVPLRNPRITTEISVIPLSRVRPGLDRTAWKTYPGSHKVMLTRDSLYEVCLLPCVSPQTIKLRPNQAVSWKY